ncbi:MAG TPA: flagellar export chaperone FliS [Bryobacteraceae bacterium]|jgi:flagellar protein FliS|nr:flagellar export chaperone FliS [Bryobacteraceae bacterium]
MPSNPYTSYLDATVLTAEPVELVRILYQGALDSVGNARVHLEAGDILARSKAICRAMDILRELSFSLNHKAEPALARNLAELYDYMQRQLLTAQHEQSDAPLAEVAGLLGTLSEAWDQATVRAI